MSQGDALRGRLKAEDREGKYFEKAKVVPFRELAEEYEAELDGRRSRKGDDRARVKRWIGAFGDQDASTISERQIEKVLSTLRTEKKKPGTVVRHLTVLKAIFNRAKRLRLVRDNPAVFVRTIKPNNVLVRYLTSEQEVRLLDHLPPAYHAVVITAMHTGLRQGELLRLVWSDVDWNAGILTIQEPKGGERRRIPMNSTVVELLVGQQKSQIPLLPDRIFSHDARYLRRAFKRAVLTAGLTPFRFHDLRHTFASRLAMQGENDRTLMALGGWKSPAMLGRYAHCQRLICGKRWKD
jgi:integrase